VSRVLVRMFAVSDRPGGGVDVRGLDDFSRDLAKVSKELQKQIKSLGRELVMPTVQDAKKLARQGHRQQPAMAMGTIMRTEFYRGAPAIKAGGSQKVAMSYPTRARARGKHKVPAGAVFFGAEFGASKLPQFPKRTPKLGRGNAGAFLWPSIRKHISDGALLKEYQRRVVAILSQHNF